MCLESFLPGKPHQYTGNTFAKIYINFHQRTKFDSTRKDCFFQDSINKNTEGTILLFKNGVKFVSGEQKLA